MPTAGDVIAEKYKIEQLIGVGGMGAVFAASHQFTGKRVALKWMLPSLARDADAVERFLREARAAGQINHPNVVDVYDVGKHQDAYFMVMELLSGEPLTQTLARGGLTSADVLGLLLPAMRGVAAAHRQGVIHRDLKPDNIFLVYQEDGKRREPKVLDFGISKLASEDKLNFRLTRTGAVIGTPYYMSPEQFRGSGELDQRVDIYAFGVILYESLTGRVPFEADSYGALVLEVAAGRAKPLQTWVPDLPAELSSIVLRAMAADAAMRYSTMEALSDALEPFANTGVTFQLPSGYANSVPPPAHTPRPVSTPSRSRLTPVGSTLQFQQRASMPGTGTRTPSAPYNTTTGTPYTTEYRSASHAQVRKPSLSVMLIAGGAAALGGMGLWYFTQSSDAMPGNVVKAHVGVGRADSSAHFVHPDSSPSEAKSRRGASQPSAAAEVPRPSHTAAAAADGSSSTTTAEAVPPPSMEERIPPTAAEIARQIEASAQRGDKDRGSVKRTGDVYDFTAGDGDRSRLAAKRYAHNRTQRAAQDAEDTTEDLTQRARKPELNRDESSEEERPAKPETLRPARRARSGELSVDEF